ncbi:hypothetical protein SDC9_118470 [bioreactor metagenome]|uniref:Uncharacterized protein n=1 Tax=bioreactor metagenome TaxID=1076179 RepID=A0A645C1T9_9ZZZZ
MNAVIVTHQFIRRPDGAQAGRLRGHHVDAVAVFHRQRAHALPNELDYAVFDKTALEHRLDKGDGDILGADTMPRLSRQQHARHLGQIQVPGAAQQLLGQLTAALAHRHGPQSAVARMAVRPKDHPAAAGHFFPVVAVDHGHVGGHIGAAVLFGGGQREGVVILVDRPAHRAQAVVAVGQHIGHGEGLKAAGPRRLNDAHIGNIMGCQ